MSMIEKFLYAAEFMKRDEIIDFLGRAKRKRNAAEVDSECPGFVYEEGNWKYVLARFWHDKGIAGSETVYYNRIKVFEMNFSYGERDIVKSCLNSWHSRN